MLVRALPCARSAGALACVASSCCCGAVTQAWGEQVGMPLLCHGESTDQTSDVFDREVCCARGKPGARACCLLLAGCCGPVSQCTRHMRGACCSWRRACVLVAA